MKILNKRKGFSFIEIIIAIIILSGLATFLAFVIPNNFSTSQQTQDVLKATDLAKRYIEEVKYQLSKPLIYDEIAEGATPPIPITSEISANGYFTVTTEVNFVGRSGREETLKEIDVTFKKTGNPDPLIKLSIIVIKPEDSV